MNILDHVATARREDQTERARGALAQRGRGDIVTQESLRVGASIRHLIEATTAQAIELRRRRHLLGARARSGAPYCVRV